MEYKGKWIDGHIHIKDEQGLSLDELNNAMEGIRTRSSLEAYAVQCLPSWDREHVLQNPLGILQKVLYPESTYFFGGLDYYVYESPNYDFASQLKTLLDIGADGIKIIETKPMVGKMIGLASMTDDAYRGFFEGLEESGAPIMWHVADPETFWDINFAPKWAIESGWFYGDGTFPTKEKLYSDVEEILTRYPNLSVTFAHMFFMAYDLERLDKWMDRFTNMRVDLTPGCEMYGGFAERHRDWRDFFLKHSGRILMGTDGGWVTGEGVEAKINHASAHANRIRRFVSTDDMVNFDDYSVKGLNLPSKVCENILYKNFVRVTGERPKKINKAAALDYFDKLGGMLTSSGDVSRLKEIREKLINV